jgi:mannose-6-phosphate isomerase-like protein (cupin superfamily)
MRYIALFLAAAGFAAAPNSEPVLWSATEMKAYDQKLTVKSQSHPRKVGAEIVNRYGNHLMWLVHREGPGDAEWHIKQADIFIVNSGEATVIVGGEMVDAKPMATNPDEMLGPSIKGGTRTKIGPGDVLHIPANTPHQVLVEPGTKFSYMIVKVIV